LGVKTGPRLINDFLSDRLLGVPDSHHIPQHKYQAALDFLDAWGRAVAGQGEPERSPDAPQQG
jgi:hypothetical protein